MQGKLLEVKRMPKDSKLKLFRLLVYTHRTDYFLTNELAQDDTQAAAQESNVRWLIEQFHCAANQLPGLQACQCRLARSRPTHLNLLQTSGSPSQNHRLSTQAAPIRRLYAPRPRSTYLTLCVRIVFSMYFIKYNTENNVNRKTRCGGSLHNKTKKQEVSVTD